MTYCISQWNRNLERVESVPSIKHADWTVQITRLAEGKALGPASCQRSLKMDNIVHLLCVHAACQNNQKNINLADL